MNNEISIGIEIVFSDKGKYKDLKVKRYRAKDGFFKEVKVLMVDEINKLAEIYDFEDIISIKFTG